MGTFHRAHCGVFYSFQNIFFTFIYFVWVHVCRRLHVEVIQLSRISSPLPSPDSENVMQDLRLGGEHLLSHLYSPVLLLSVLMYIVIISYLYYLYRSKIYKNKTKAT